MDYQESKVEEKKRVEAGGLEEALKRLEYHTRIRDHKKERTIKRGKPYEVLQYKGPSY